MKDSEEMGNPSQYDLNKEKYAKAEGWIKRILSNWNHRTHKSNELRLVDILSTDRRKAQYSQISPRLPKQLERYLRQKDIKELYTHQVEAINHIRENRDTVIACSTSSGKSLCFQLPMLERMLKEPKATGLLIYPTKALAQDQLRSLLDFDLAHMQFNTYDGDTSEEQRRMIRKGFRNGTNQVILTNPDMLHIGILPNHILWRPFIENLSVVVIDEMHTMKGVFGTHVAMILRRLWRICQYYKTRPPTVVFASATIANPTGLASQLSNRSNLTLVEKDASPIGKKWFALHQPAKPSNDSRRGTTRKTVVELLLGLLKQGKPNIVFTLTRRDAELIYITCLKDERFKPYIDRISPYRAGYTPEERRDIENKLFSQQLLAVISTTALELGVDIGSLDSVILSGFPGTMISFRQQSGRAGRRHAGSLIVLVASDNPIDQFILNNGSHLINEPVEPTVINASNEIILKQHLKCAAHEVPLVDRIDQRWFGPLLPGMLEELVGQNFLTVSVNPNNQLRRYRWNKEYSPAPRINIRNTKDQSYSLKVDEELLETSERSRVLRENYPGAVVLHRGITYIVDEVDHDDFVIDLKQKDVDYFTQAGSETHTSTTKVLDSKEYKDLKIYLGQVTVMKQLKRYRKIKFDQMGPSGFTRDDDSKSIEIVNWPAVWLNTQAVWWTVPYKLFFTKEKKYDSVEAHNSLHGAEHALIAMLPLMAESDRWDVDGQTLVPGAGEEELEGVTPKTYIYENTPGGAGIAGILFEGFIQWVEYALNHVRSCKCSSSVGCPSCIQSPHCGSFNESLSKSGAIEFLGYLYDTAKSS